MSYEVKCRNWWRRNPNWPDGREPCATPWDQCRRRAIFDTEEEAREYCQEYNRTHKPGFLSYKAEYSKVQ